MKLQVYQIILYVLWMEQQCATILMCESLLCQKHSCGDVYFSWQFWIRCKIVQIVLGTLIQIIFYTFWHICNLFLEHTLVGTYAAWSNSCLTKRTSCVSGWMYLPWTIKSNWVNLQCIPDSHIFKYFSLNDRHSLTSIMSTRCSIHLGSYM